MNFKLFNVFNTEIDYIHFYAEILNSDDCFLFHKDGLPISKFYIPCKINETSLYGVIDVNTGEIADWPKGVWGTFRFKTRNFKADFTRSDGQVEYKFMNKGVPTFMRTINSTNEYIILKVNENGKITGWSPNTIQNFLYEQCLLEIK